MRILYDHQIFTVQRFGGISRIFIELARLLSQLHECQIYWYRGLHQDGYDIADFRSRLARSWGFSRKPFLLKKWSTERINAYGFDWFRRMTCGGFDIYHPTYYDHPCDDLGKSRRLVVTVYDMIGEKFLADLDRFRLLFARKRQYIERADLVFVISEHTKKDLVDMVPIDPAKVRVTHLASRIGETSSTEPLPFTTAPYFLYVGTRSKYKNFDVLMRAFAASERLREHFKVVCFGGTSEYLPHEVEFFQQHGMHDNFLYLVGDDALLKSLYENAVALVYTSRYEGFGLPPLEAMQCGCPVICGAHSSLPEVVGDAAYIFDPESDEDLAAAMLRVADASSLREEMVRKGRARATLFSWEKTALATLDGYRAVCA